MLLHDKFEAIPICFKSNVELFRKSLNNRQSNKFTLW